MAISNKKKSIKTERGELKLIVEEEEVDKGRKR